MEELPKPYPYDIDSDLALRAIESQFLKGNDDPKLLEHYELLIKENTGR